MENAPAFQMYARDWLVKTECFSPETRGLFLLLGLFYWVSEKQDRMENDDDLICMDLKITPEKWAEMKKIALKKQLLVETEDGYLQFTMLTKSLEQQEQRRLKNAENGKKGGRPKNPEKAVGYSGKAKKSIATASSFATAKDILPSEGQPANIDDSIWGDGLSLLVKNNVPEQSARAFLGRSIKQHGKQAVNDAISATLLNNPADPKAYLAGCLKKTVSQPDAIQAGIPRLRTFADQKQEKIDKEMDDILYYHEKLMAGEI